MRPVLPLLAGACFLVSAAVAAQKKTNLDAVLNKILPDLDGLYVDLHRTPELSLHEEKTAAKLAERLKRLGFDVTSGVGGHGLVGLLRNGEGPTVLVRADLDALPVAEKTGLSYASQATIRTPDGTVLPLMHACGHDLHMTAWIGAATLLAAAKDDWHGTLMMAGQPAEEIGTGARAMLKDGLYTRFGKPDFALALHDTAVLPTGKLGYTEGHTLASMDFIDITIYGKGGHGAYPHSTIDPVVIAARTISTLQTLVSREKNPLDPAVVTVGSVHGGTKHNIIPDEVRLAATLRSYKDEVRERLLAGLTRVVNAEAQAAGAPRMPEIKILSSTPATYNDPTLTRRIAAALRGRFGQANVLEVPPVMGGDDFSEYGRAGVPAMLFWVGAVEPTRWAQAAAAGKALPPLHSAEFAPDRESAIRPTVQALTTAVMELLGK
jgi:hippurate hydrolase